MGPATIPTMETVDHAAKARRRSLSSKVVIRIDNVEGISSDPPMPIAARTATSCHGGDLAVNSVEQTLDKVAADYPRCVQTTGR